MTEQTTRYHLFRRKSLDTPSRSSSATGEGVELKRVLSSWDVTIFGVGAIVGAGIFVLSGVAAADYAGPAIVISFAIAAFTCIPVALSFAELASMIPVAGSVYTYAYTAFGEFLAFLIAWDLLLEYTLGAGAVSTGWSAYALSILQAKGIALPGFLTTNSDTISWLSLAATLLSVGILYTVAKSSYLQGPVKRLILALLSLASLASVTALAMSLSSFNLLATAIIWTIALSLILGASESTKLANILVVIQTLVIVIFIAVGMPHVEFINFEVFMPYGVVGIFTGTAVVFYSFLGFNNVTTLAEECKEPQKALPVGIIASLIICSVLYIGMAAVMTGCVPYFLLRSPAPLSVVLQAVGELWLIPYASLGALAGLSSTLLVGLYSQSRLAMSISRDGLIAPFFSHLHKRFATPAQSIIFFATLSSLAASLLPIEELAKLCNIGTLAAFEVVCIGVIVLRYTNPDKERTFKCPGSPVVPALGAVSSLVLMLSLPALTWEAFLLWVAIGVGFYFAYSYKHSLENEKEVNSKI